MTFLPFSLSVQSCKSVTVTTRLALKTLVYCDYELNRNEPEALRTLVFWLIETGFMNPEVCVEIGWCFISSVAEGKYSEKRFLSAWFLCFFSYQIRQQNDLCQLWFAILTILTCFQWDWVSFVCGTASNKCNYLSDFLHANILFYPNKEFLLYMVGLGNCPF